jgi:HlyD family secretion protein
MGRRTIRWSIFVLLVAGAGFWIWHYTRPKPIVVVVKPAEMGPVERTVANTRAGTVMACRRAKLSPGTGGQIDRLPVKEGDRVKSGDLLLQLWNKDLVAEKALAQSEAAAALVRVRSICLKADEAARQAERLLKLHRLKAISEERLDEAVTQADALRAECESSRTSVLTSQERVRVVEANIDRTRLVAPFDGVVAKINGELNEFITPSPPGIPTPPAVDLIDNACFYVNAPIDEVDAPGIRPGMTARLTLDAFKDRHFEGKVRRIAPYVQDREKQARTVDVEVEFTRKEDIRKLMAGYSADAEIILEVRHQTLRIPTEAVLDGKRVFVYIPDEGIVRERQIQKGLSNCDYTEVLSGLKAGERVVTNVDAPGLKDGAMAVLEREGP